MTTPKNEDCTKWEIEISDDDIFAAMKDMEGFIDITLSDFRELYHFAFKHAWERLFSDLTAQDIMSSEVIFVTEDTRLPAIVETMAENSISGVPVVDNHMAVSGVISEKDILHHMGDEGPKSFMGILAECLGTKRCFAATLQDLAAKSIMSSPSITAVAESTVIEINCILTKHNINRVPIVNPNRELIGIVSRADALKAQFGNRER
ncbi:MAG: CBS domain-containing protein [Desulforhopalus sp.]|nr:CBS domain-containing protein [Desulforhopalus sp.]